MSNLLVKDLPGVAESERQQFHLRWTVISVFAAATGIAAVAIAYALGRNGLTATGNWIYWLGYIALVLPLVIGVSRLRNFSRADSLVVLGLLTTGSYFLKWMYSPLLLKFQDELQHLRGLENARNLGHLGATNYGLTIAEDFPGLSALGSTVSRASNLPPETTAFVIGALLHVLICVSAYLFFDALLERPRSVAIAMIAYAANSGFPSYSSYYVYQNLAFPFLLIGLLAVVKLYRQRERAFRWMTIALLCQLFCLAAHHITSIALAVVLLVTGIAELLKFHGRRNVPIIILAFTAPSLCALWLTLVTTDFFRYIKAYGAVTSGSEAHPATFGVQPGISIGAPPVLNSLLALAAICIVLGTIILGWANYARLPVEHMKLPLLVLGSTLFAAVAARAILPTGQEVLVRSEPFVYLAAAVLYAALFELGQHLYFGRHYSAASRRLKLARRAGRQLTPSSTGFVLATATLLVGGICGAWPAWWLRVPQGYLESGFERGVDAHINNAADWVAENLPPGGRIAADNNGETALSTRGNQQYVSAVSLAFFEPTLNDTALSLLRKWHVQYVWVDSRIPFTQTSDGTYFPDLPRIHGARPSVEAMSKFDRAPGVSKIYDDGTIAIYDVRGLE